MPYGSEDYAHLEHVFVSHRMLLVVGGIMSASAIAANQWFTGIKLKSVTEDVSRIQADMATIKTDMAAMKTGMATIKTDMSTIKTDMATIKMGIDILLERVPPK